MVAKIRQHVIVVIIVALICALASRPAAQSAIPAPSLDGLEPLVAAQLREVRQQLDSTVTRDAADPKKLADAYGSVAQVYHAYEFFDAVEAAYISMPFVLHRVSGNGGIFSDASISRRDKWTRRSHN